MDLHKQAWERVLAAVEADARRAEAMLQTPADEPLPAELAEVDAPPLAVPADWVLPGSAAHATGPVGSTGPVTALAPALLSLTAPALPPLSEMPPVPPELRDRIEALRAQIEDLQRQLVQALEQWQPHRVMAAVQPEAQPVYVDRRV